MKPKIIIIVVLLLFVCAGLAGILLKKSAPTPPNNSTAASNIPNSFVSTADIKMDSGVVAYYFHGARRCVTCRTIEAYTNEALQTGFSEAIKTGRLVWQVVNIDDPGNSHFVQDFQLSSSSVVLVKYDGGQPSEWKNLNRVWQIVHGDKNVFFDYIQTETRAYLEEKTP